MTKRRQPRVWLGLVLTVLLGATPAPVAGATARTLIRFQDPVILPTGLLHALPDHRTAKCRLYRLQGGSLEPVPFQFDARDDDGDLVFPKTPAAEEFIFDDNDELVFMAKDVGDRAGREMLPPDSDGALEIVVTDPIDGTVGWAYLVHFADQVPPRSPIRYATFDEKTNEVRALFYRMTYFPGRNFFTGMRITPEGGGTGENLLSRMKVRVQPNSRGMARLGDRARDGLRG